MIIAPRRDEVISEQGVPTRRMAEYMERVSNSIQTIEDSVAAITANTSEYTASNVTTDRSFNADTVAVAELADIVGTLIADLKSAGVIQ